MANSLVIDWLNENSLRAYPLKEAISRVSGGYTLDDGVILDAQFVYASIPDEVYLTQIEADSLNVTFTITGLPVFIISRTAVFPAYIRTSSGNLLVVGASTATIPEGIYTFSNVAFEYSVSHDFGGGWLGVESLSFNGSGVIDGDVIFEEGYQFGIRVNTPNITLSCGAGYGKPISCNTFGTLDDDCNTIVSFVNGIGPDGKKVLHFRNGGGIVILEDPDNHRIFIGLASNPNEDTCKAITINPGV